MQTFLPFDNFSDTAKCLDRMRLGKQRVEAMQILQAITFNTRWKNHPAVLMWKGHRNYLVRYGVAICDEWIRRGYKDTCRDKILAFNTIVSGEDTPPKFLGNTEFHIAHRSNLIRKNRDHYATYFGNIPDDLPYIWKL